ncbi:MAG: hypothetical protein ACHQF2_09010 [Flavobacteriales bacterium]
MKLTLLFILLSLTSYSQTDSINISVRPTPFSPNNTSNTLAIKGKILPWVMGNNGGVNGGLGIEQGFCKGHSIGAEWNFNRWAKHYDNDSGYSDDIYHRDRALVANYRFYYSGIGKKRRGVCFYHGISYRYGRLKYEWSEPLAVNYNILQIKYYNAVGFLSGFFIGFEDSKTFGIDINAGVYYNMKQIHNTYTPSSGIANGTMHANTWDFRIGFNFMWWFTK